MSKQLILFLLSAAIIPVILAACLENKTSSSSRGITSKSLPTHSGKFSPLKVQLSLVSEVPESPSDTTQLEAEIILNANSQRIVQYQWVLDSGVILTEGAQQGSVNLDPHQSVKIKVAVRGFTQKVLAHVSLIAKVTSDGITLSQSANVASAPDQTFESVAPLIHEALDKDKKEAEKEGN